MLIARLSHTGVMAVTVPQYISRVKAVATMSRSRYNGKRRTAAFVVSPELKAELERLASRVSKPRGAVLFRRGEQVSGAFLIRKGKVALELDPASPIYPVRTLGPGCVAGLPATVSGAPYSLTAKVLEDSELGYIPRKQVIKLLAANSQLCLLAMELVSQEISRMRSAVKLH